MAVFTFALTENLELESKMKQTKQNEMKMIRVKMMSRESRCGTLKSNAISYRLFAV